MPNAPSNRRLWGLLAATLVVLGLASATTSSAVPFTEAAMLPKFSDTIPNFGDRRSARVREVQFWLRDRGFRPGPIDGWYGNQTLNAIKRFQQAATDQQLYSGPIDGLWSVAIDQATIGWGDRKVAAPVQSTSGLPCPEYHALLEAYGLPVASFAPIMWRESRCNPNAYNGRGADNSHGLLQINTKGSNYGVWQRWCGITSREQLFNPETNIRCAAAAYREMGLRPWRT